MHKTIWAKDRFLDTMDTQMVQFAYPNTHIRFRVKPIKHVFQCIPSLTQYTFINIQEISFNFTWL